MIARGPGHYVVGRTTKVARAQARENVGATWRKVEPTGIAVERSETFRARRARTTGAMEPTGIEPLTSCLQSRRVDDGWRRMALTGAGFGQFSAGSRRLVRARDVTSS
jgi:hypothetical protein